MKKNKQTSLKGRASSAFKAEASLLIKTKRVLRDVLSHEQ
jgi:hypothetical protein